MLFKNILLGKNVNAYKGGLGVVLSPGLAQCHGSHRAQAQSWLLHQPQLLLPSCVILKQISEIMLLYLDVIIVLVSISEKSACISKR